MKKVPKGKGRKSNAETYRDAMEVLKLVDHDCLTHEEVAAKTGLSRSTVYRLLARARSAILAPQNKANREAAEPLTKKWYELSSPEPSQAPLPVEDGTVAVPATPVELPPQVPPPIVEAPRLCRGAEARPSVLTTPQIKRYEPSPRPVRKPGEDDLTWKSRWRRWQVDEQVMENLLNGADGPVLRGRPNRSGVCFGNCPPFQCTCHDEGAFEL